jgi:MraZ protein
VEAQQRTLALLPRTYSHLVVDQWSEAAYGGTQWHVGEGPRGSRQQQTGRQVLTERFVGTFEHGLDEKGRLVLPSRIRAHIGSLGIVAKLDRCLGLWTPEGFDRVAQRLEEAVDAGTAHPDALRVFHADAWEASPDAQGRIVLPLRLRTFAALDREVVITGRGSRAEIWDSTRWNEILTKGDNDLMSAVTSLRL